MSKTSKTLLCYCGKRVDVENNKSYTLWINKKGDEFHFGTRFKYVYIGEWYIGKKTKDAITLSARPECEAKRESSQEDIDNWWALEDISLARQKEINRKKKIKGLHLQKMLNKKEISKIISKVTFEDIETLGRLLAKEILRIKIKGMTKEW